MKCETLEHDSSISRGWRQLYGVPPVPPTWVLIAYCSGTAVIIPVCMPLSPSRPPANHLRPGSFQTTFYSCYKSKPRPKGSEAHATCRLDRPCHTASLSGGVDLNDPGISGGTYLKEGGVSGTTTVDMSCSPRWVMVR